MVVALEPCYIRQMPHFTSGPSALCLYALVLALGGCATGSAYGGRVTLASSPEIEIVDASAKIRRNGLRIGGDVRRAKGQSGPVAGQLHVEARDAQGALVASTDAPWGEFKLRRLRLAFFRALLLTATPKLIMSVTVMAQTKPGSLRK